MTDGRFETRLRRDLAELGAVPRNRDREWTPPTRKPPAATLVVALTVVLALVAASFVIVRSSEDRGSKPVGSTTSDAATTTAAPTTTAVPPPNPPADGFATTMTSGWTRLLPPSTAGNFVEGLSGIASGPKGTVVLGTETGCGDAEGFWSRDDRTWHVVSHPPVVGLALFECSGFGGVAATDSGFVAVGNTERSGGTSSGTTTGLVWTSADGDSWKTLSKGSTFTGQLLESIASDGNVIVAGGSRDLPTGGTSAAEIWYSVDGSQWTRVALGDQGDVKQVVHGPRGWVAVGTGFVWRSEDGRHWVRVDGFAGDQLSDAAAGPGGFIAHGDDASSEVFFTSVDGLRWRQQPPVSTVASTNGPFVDGIGVLGSHFLAVGQVSENYPDTRPALWVLEGDSWVRVALPQSIFFESPTPDPTNGALQPVLTAGLETADGSLLLVGGGRPSTQIAKPSYGPRIWRWKPPA